MPPLLLLLLLLLVLLQGSAGAAAASAWLEAHAGAPNAAPWNGGVGTAQRSWLTQQLQAAAADSQRVIVACHHPLAQGSAPEPYLAYDAQELCTLLEYEGTPVAVVLSGHYHPGGYVQRGAVHYCVLAGVLEAPAGDCAHAVLEIWPDVLLLRGRGTVPNMQLPLLPLSVGLCPPAVAAAAAAAAAANDDDE